jgi:membrane protein required for colicin V production
MNYLDILILFPALWFGYKGFTHGLVRELAGLAALILGIYAAFMFSDWVEKWINHPEFPKEVYFAITFLGVLVAVFFIGRIVEKIIKLMIPEFINNLLGVFFGVAKVAVLFSVIIFFVQSIDSKQVILTEKRVEKSFTYKYIEPIAPYLKGWYDDN